MKNRCLAAIAAFTLLACAGRATHIRDSAPRHELRADTLARVRDTVVAARRLSFADDHVEVVQVDEQQFTELVRAQGRESTAAEQGLAEVFSWAQPNRGPRAGGGKPFEESVAAYYDSKQDRIVAPIDETGPTPEKLSIFAHELHHALQQRHFDIGRMRRMAPDEEARLALLALVEGDAQVTMGAYLGATHGIPISRALRRLTDLVAGVRIHHGSKIRRTAAGESPHIVSFPYREGMRFVADLYRAGGFDLVNRAYEHPPMSTMHILHPDRYIAGELPAVVARPKPLGKAIAAGTWGELRTRMVLASCVPVSRARAIAALWRGDHYVLGQRERAHTLSWVSVWSDVAAARSFAKALERCAVPHRRVHREQDRVLVTVNSSKAAHAAQAAALVSHPVTQPPPLPLADVEIPVRAPIPERRRGRMKGTRYQSIWLGLSAQTPRHMRSRVPKAEALELMVFDDGTRARGLLALYDHVPRGRSLDALFGEVLQALQAGTGQHVTKAFRRSKRSDLGPVVVERYAFSFTGAVEVEVLPICAETGALVFVRTWHDDRGRRALHAWKKSFRWIVDRRIPACRWLDPK